MGIRTPDLLNAIEALYQLSYDPSIFRQQLFPPEFRMLRSRLREPRTQSWRISRRQVAKTGFRFIKIRPSPLSVFGNNAPLHGEDKQNRLDLSGVVVCCESSG